MKPAEKSVLVIVKAFDVARNSKTCSQRVTVIEQADDYVVRFPDDVIVTNCASPQPILACLCPTGWIENMSITF